MSLVVRALYRGCLHLVRELNGEPLRVRLPVHASRAQWLDPRAPQGGYVQEEETHQAVLARSFPQLFAAMPADASEITPRELLGAIRAEFRQPPEESSSPIDLGEAFELLKRTSDQIRLAKVSSVSRTDEPDGVGVAVEATSAFRGRQMSPSGPGPWVFQYRIRVSNYGLKTVQLLGREWSIRNNDGSIHAEVPRGSPGVVGQTPVLRPGQQFEYSSGTTFDSPGGSVQGSFQMVTLDEDSNEIEEKFDCAVNPFQCLVPEGPGEGAGEQGSAG